MRSPLVDLLLSRLVAFGMLPFACSAFSFAVFVKSAIQARACVLRVALPGTARSEPPRKPGIGLPDLWLGITNCPVTFVNFLPVQQLNQPGPKIAAVRLCEKTVYGAGFASFSVEADFGDVEWKKFL